MYFEPREYLRHILAEADYLIRERCLAWKCGSEVIMADETRFNG